MALAHTHNLAEGAGASTIVAAKKICKRLRGKKVVLQMSGCNEPMRSLRDIVNLYERYPKTATNI